MDDLKIFDLEKSICLNMSVIDFVQAKDDYIFLDILDKKNINLSDDIKILDEVKVNGYVEQYVYVDLDFFLDDMKSTFNSAKRIEHQFFVDVPRCEIYINKHLIKDPKKISKFLYYKFDKTTSLNIMMLTTQSLMGLPFELIFNNIDNDKYHLAELDQNVIGKKPYQILINLTNDNISFKAYKVFRIFTIENGDCKNCYKVYVKLEFDYMKKDNLLINIKVSNY